MNITLAVGFLGGWEIFGILLVVLLLFGAKRLPELARSLGSGIKEFKKATKDVTDDLKSALDVDDQPGQYKPNRPRRPATSQPRATPKPIESNKSENASETSSQEEQSKVSEPTNNAIISQLYIKHIRRAVIIGVKSSHY